MVIKQNGMVVTNAKGYRTARSSYGVNVGSWYWEATIESSVSKRERQKLSREYPDPHWRLGWGTTNGELQAPVGYDKHSYSYRDLLGCKVHQAKREAYADSYTVGDVVGFFIHLPQSTDDKPPQTVINKQTGKPEIELQVLEGSSIVFYNNGKSQGVAFQDIYKGTYYPAISLYFDATVSLNFGPDFRYPPSDVKYQPMCLASQIRDELVAQANKEKEMLVAKEMLAAKEIPQQLPGLPVADQTEEIVMTEEFSTMILTPQVPLIRTDSSGVQTQLS